MSHALRNARRAHAAAAGRPRASVWTAVVSAAVALGACAQISPGPEFAGLAPISTAPASPPPIPTAPPNAGAPAPDAPGGVLSGPMTASGRLASALRRLQSGPRAPASAPVQSPPTAEAIERLADAAGALLIVGASGSSPAHPQMQALSAEIAAGRVGGVVLFERNIKSPAAAAALIAHLRAQAPRGDLLVAVDQEGGAVARLRARNGFRNYPSAARLATWPAARAEASLRDMARAVAGLGIDVSFGPVLDLALEPRNAVIVRNRRSYGADPAVVADLASGFVRAHAAAGVTACAKHFPGHGASLGDTHTTDVSLEGRWRPALELAPYAALLAPRGAPRLGCVMTSHLRVPALTGSRDAVVTFSARAIGLLREGLGFDGAIVTDDLRMAAARRPGGVANAAVAAIAAGHDLALIGGRRSGRRAIPEAFRAAIADGLRSGRLSPRRLQEALRRRAAMRAPAARAGPPAAGG